MGHAPILIPSQMTVQFDLFPHELTSVTSGRSSSRSTRCSTSSAKAEAQLCRLFAVEQQVVHERGAGLEGITGPAGTWQLGLSWSARPAMSFIGKDGVRLEGKLQDSDPRAEGLHEAEQNSKNDVCQD